MDTDEQPVVLPSSTTSGLSLSLCAVASLRIVGLTPSQPSTAHPKHFRALDTIETADQIGFALSCASPIAVRGLCRDDQLQSSGHCLAPKTADKSISSTALS